MKHSVLLRCCCVLLLVGCLIVVSANEDDQENSSSFRIAGYLPDYRFGSGIDLNATAALVDDIYLFSLSPQTQLGPQMFSLCCLKPDDYQQAREARAHARNSHNREIKLWVTVGGAGRSHNFVAHPSAMVTALHQVVEQEQLDGVDFDCESFKTHQDYTDYEILVRNAAKILRSKGNIPVSVALHYGQKMPQDVYDNVARVNLMAYDIPAGKYHADLEEAKKAVDSLIESGCPAHKIFLGIPAYGRHKHNPSNTKTYAELIDKALGSSVEASSEVAFAMSDYLFDSPKAVGKKVNYAVGAGLGGVFFWELGQDKQTPAAPGGTLLKAAATAVPKKAPPATEDTNGEDVSPEQPKDEL